MAACGVASAQCDQFTLLGGPKPGGTFSKATTWDVDGPGGVSPQLVAFGTPNGFATAGVVRWDGDAWQPMGGTFARVDALLSWDPDGAGPRQSQLVLAGKVASANDGTTDLFRWTGTTWQQFTSLSGGALAALVAWDADGPGPGLPRLVAGGDFNNAGGVSAHRLAWWDGSAWHATNANADANIRSLLVWEQDDAGPLAPVLVVGGSFTTIGGGSASCIATWNGSTWQALGNGLAAPITQVPSALRLATFDPDGDGPGTSQIIAAGNFDFAGTGPANQIARWDGLAWSALGAGPGYIATAMVARDSGLATGALYVSGTNSVRVWNGSTWTNAGAGIAGLATALVAWDRDGSSITPPQVVAAGLTSGDGVPVGGIGGWNGTTWLAFGEGMDNSVLANASWDTDGAGPQEPSLYVGGSFTAAGGRQVRHFAQWNGSQWIAPGGGTNAEVDAMTTWDADGNGPGSDVLLLVGYFSKSGGAGVGTWNGTTLTMLGARGDGVLALTTWDEDGSGPGTPAPVAGGNTSTSPQYLAKWNGTAWSSIGSAEPNASVTALTEWDPDGSGPLLPRLVAGGTFTAIGSLPAPYIAVAGPGGWAAMSSGMSGRVFSVTSWDTDGSGPLPPVVVAGGEFTFAGGNVVNNLAMWNGTTWQAFGSGTNGRVERVGTWDPDGSGPRDAELVISGPFSNVAGVNIAGVTGSRAARFNGTTWQSLGDANGPITTWDPDGAGSIAPRLVLGRSVFAEGPAPVITSQPADQLLCSAATSATFAVASSSSGLGYRWQREAAPGMGIYFDLSDGPTGAGSTISGSATDTLAIASPVAADAGRYRVQLIADCGLTNSNPAMLAYCLSDFNCDGFLDFTDFDDFVAAFESGAPSADFNDDGFLDFTDFDSFVSAFETGC